MTIAERTLTPHQTPRSARRIVLRSFQSPGDVLMLTAAVRDLCGAHPGKFAIDVRTSCPALWENNPNLTPLGEADAGVESLDMHYPLIHESNQRPYHFIHGYVQYLEERLGLRIPVTRFSGDIHLSSDEKTLPPECLGPFDREPRFWIIIAGGKYDFTAKWWNPASYQAVIDHFRGRIQFVQCGEANHWHPPLNGVINLVGKTTLRQFLHLMHWADGVVCPVTFAMHLAAAVEMRPGRPPHRPCVVIAGGREPPHWEAYPHHQFISLVGALPCCAQGGCWKSRCQSVCDGDPKDHHDLCVAPVQLRPDLRIPQCMDLISAEDVINRIELYYRGGALEYASSQFNRELAAGRSVESEPVRAGMPMQAKSNHRKPQTVVASVGKISVAFHHGLGDCVYFAHLIALYIRRAYEIEVECTPDKRILFEAAGAKVISAGAAASHPWGYPAGYTHAGHGQFWQGSKMGHNLSQPPLPNIGEKPDLWKEYCDSRIDINPHLSAETIATVERWLAPLPRPVVLLHTKGNTNQHKKSLPDSTAAEFYKALLDRFDGSIILLDWDNRVPRLASYRVRHLDELGPCPLETLLALMTSADLMIGVDSGPLHLARFSSTPTIGVWMPGHYPATYTLPRQEQLNVVLGDHTREWNRFKRIPWDIVEHPGASYDASHLAEICVRMLETPRYLFDRATGSGRSLIAPDVQLQQFVREWCRGTAGNALSGFADRHRSFDVLFREISRRFESPTIVETGTIRAEEDWGGAGFFTYLAAAYLAQRGGRLHSVDLSQANCQFARVWTDVFGAEIHIHCQDSVTFLTNFTDPIDVLYLDSLDTTEPNHAEHAQRELEVGMPRLHERSLIVIDDTPWHGGAWIGKGARVVPLLLSRGWRILYAGYQVVLCPGDAPSDRDLARERAANRELEYKLQSRRVGTEPQIEHAGQRPSDDPTGDVDRKFPAPVIMNPSPNSKSEYPHPESRFPAPCQCVEPGWCARHNCYKHRAFFEYCRRSIEWFDLWERGDGPRSAPPDQSNLGSKAAGPASPHNASVQTGAPGLLTDCIHMGSELRREACPTCGGHVELKIFACEVHRECALSVNATGVHCCQSCAEYQQASAAPRS